MIPAKTTCPEHWTVEYEGYLMSDPQHSTYVCVDQSLGSVAGKRAHSEEHAQLSVVGAKCGGLQCPPYSEEKELSCVVCTH